MAILPFLAMCFRVLKGFVYTITVDVYAFRLAFSGKSHCILHQNARHLAANSPETGASGGLFK